MSKPERFGGVSGPPPSRRLSDATPSRGRVLLAELFSAGRRRVVGGRVLLGEGLPARGRGRVVRHLPGAGGVERLRTRSWTVVLRRPAARRGRRAAARPVTLWTRDFGIRPRSGREPRFERGDLVRRGPMARRGRCRSCQSCLPARCGPRQLSRETIHLQFAVF